MSILKRLRMIAILALPLAAGACAGSDPIELIPAGLRTSIAAEDRGQKKGPDAAISVNDMLARARGGRTEPANGASTAPAAAVAGPVAEPASAPAAAEPVEPAVAPPIKAASRAGDEPSGAAVHPLWAKMNAQRAGAAPMSSTVDVAASGPGESQTPVSPVARPSGGPSVMIRFPGAVAELPDGEKARLDAAVTLHKATASSVRVMAGPASEGAVFQRLLIAERRSQAVDKALPSELERSRVFSPEVEADSVRVEFQPTPR